MRTLRTTRAKRRSWSRRCRRSATAAASPASDRPRQRAGAQDELAQFGDALLVGLHHAGYRSSVSLGSILTMVIATPLLMNATTTPSWPGQATGLTSKDTVDDLDGEQADGDHSGIVAVIRAPGRNLPRRDAPLSPRSSGPQPTHGVVRRLADDWAMALKASPRRPWRRHRRTGRSGRVVPLTGHLEYTVQSETSTVRIRPPTPGADLDHQGEAPPRRDAPPGDRQHPRDVLDRGADVGRLPAGIDHLLPLRVELNLEIVRRPSDSCRRVGAPLVPVRGPATAGR